MVQKDKIYLVTGATGFLGEPLVKRIIEQGGKVRAFARNEGKLIMLREKYPTIEIVTGDVADKTSLRHALTGVDGIFHLAAFKHVGMAEDQSRECISSNTIGSLNLMELTDGRVYDFILCISTDKAAQVAGVYGASKLLMERLWQQFEKQNPQTKYRIVRYGNVLYSTGSVLCKWKDILEKGGDITITDPNATRFFWTVDQALDLIEECLEKAEDTTPFCPEMKAMMIEDILQAMVNKYGEPSGVKMIGLQPGENLHEKVLEEGPYSNEVELYTVEEIMEMV